MVCAGRPHATSHSVGAAWCSRPSSRPRCRLPCAHVDEDARPKARALVLLAGPHPAACIHLPLRLRILSQMCTLSNMTRAQFDAWVNPQGFITQEEELHRAALVKLEPRVTPCLVKLTGFAADGSLVTHASGLLYTKDDGLILTCKRLRYFTDPHQPQQREVAVFKALYHDGTEEEVEVYMPPHAVIVDHDLMLLRGTRRAATQLLAGYPSSGDAVCMAGFAPGSATACFSKARIESVSLTAMHINADEGWIGGPVFESQFCRLVGVMSKGADAHNKQPEAIPSTLMHLFLLQSGAPGLTE